MSDIKNHTYSDIFEQVKPRRDEVVISGVIDFLVFGSFFSKLKIKFPESTLKIDIRQEREYPVCAGYIYVSAHNMSFFFNSEEQLMEFFREDI